MTVIVEITLTRPMPVLISEIFGLVKPLSIRVNGSSIIIIIAVCPDQVCLSHPLI